MSNSKYENVELTKYFLSEDVKNALGECIFSNFCEASYQNYQQLSYLLRYSKLYQGCIYSYGSQSEGFKKQVNLNDPNQFSQYLKKVIQKFDRIATDPHYFVFDFNFKRKQSGLIDKSGYKQGYEIIKLNYNLANEKQSRAKIDEIIYQLLKLNLQNCFKIYNKDKVQGYKQKYKKMVKMTSNPYNLEGNSKQKFPDKNQWEDILFHSLNINVLEQIINDLKQSQNKYNRLFELLCKPIADKFSDVVAEKMVAYTQKFPNLDENSIDKKQEDRQIKNRYEIYNKPKEKTFKQIQFSDDIFKHQAMLKIGDIKNQQEELQKSEEYQYFRQKARERREKAQKKSVSFPQVKEKIIIKK